MKSVEQSAIRSSTLLERLHRQKTQKRLTMMVFAALPIILMLVFTVIPLIEMFAFSFFDMRYTGKPRFIGLKNYIEVFIRKDMLASLKLSGFYLVGSVIQITLALYLATVLSFKLRGSNFYKAVFFFPFLINGIAVGFIFKFFYTHGYVLDTVLQFFGFELDELPFWLRDKSINNWSIVFGSIWRYCGQAVILYIGAIMSIDNAIYEAADLDGANSFQRFIHIILPSIKPVVVLNVILSVKGALAAFDMPYVMTDGHNGTATYFILMHRFAHEQQRVGYASAMAFVLLALILFVTLIQKVIFKYVIKD